MKKRILYTTISLMSLSLIGIIGIQIYWIYTSIELKQTQFDQLVTQSLNEVIVDIENRESIFFLHNQLSNSKFTFDSDSITLDSNDVIWRQGHFSGDSLSIEIENIVGGALSSIKEDLRMSININEEEEINIERKIREVEEALFSDSTIANGKKQSSIYTITNRLGKFVVKMAQEFENRANPLEHFLQQVDLDSIITLKLAGNGIVSPYTYGVLYNAEIIDTYSSPKYQVSKNNYDVSLFKNDITEKPAKLSISFKNKGLFIFKSMWFIIVCSILFTLIILITYASTLHHIIKQKKLSDIKNDFINNMTHEFKTPISTISLAIDSITHSKVIDDQEKINHYAEIIRKENKRMNTQVESVLNTALAERDELQLNKASFHLNDLIVKISERMKLQLEAHHAQLNMNLCRVDLSVFGDEMHLQNALCNLIDNAIKYNTNDPKININTSLRNGFSEIKIIDNGIGMSAETQKRVFDKFYRAQKGDIHTIKGFGIGLSYVKAIIDAHSGTIELKSKPNFGTTIIIRLPLTKK